MTEPIPITATDVDYDRRRRVGPARPGRQPGHRPRLLTVAGAITPHPGPVRVITARAVGFVLVGVALFDGAGHQPTRAGR